MNKHQIKTYIKNRLRERSTWVGVIAVLDVCGVMISPEAAEQIIGLGILLAGGAAAVIPDNSQSQAGDKG